MAIYVCDSIMGAGKTSAAITMMNEAPEKRYLFITPYLAEGERIRDACPGLDFCSPVSVGKRPKIFSLEELLASGRNIVSTHALFTHYRQRTIDLIRSNGYTLVLDEVMNVIEAEPVNTSDIAMLFRKGFIAMDDDGQHVKWIAEAGEAYDGCWKELMWKAQLGNLLYYQNRLLFWELPTRSFAAFKDVYILTYMFKAQMQAYYYDTNGIKYSYIGVSNVDGVYRFSPTGEVPDHIRQLKEKVHIFENEKLNSIGENRNRRHRNRDTTLSCTWYRNAGGVKKRTTAKDKENDGGDSTGDSEEPVSLTFMEDIMSHGTVPDSVYEPEEDAAAPRRRKSSKGSATKKKKSEVGKVEQLGRNLSQVFRYHFKASSDDIIWTTFKPYRQRIGSYGGFLKSFLPYNIRATNTYQDRHYLAYLVNVFFNPDLKNYFAERGATIDEQAYALSEMVQWIWRSAIRKGEEIWIYVPSKRMRWLLIRWLDDLAAGGDGSLSRVVPVEDED